MPDFVDDFFQAPERQRPNTVLRVAEGETVLWVVAPPA